MSKITSKIKNLIQDYLLEEGFLQGKIPNNNLKLDFGFFFSFPPGPMGKRMSVFKLKEKNFIIISINTQISKKQVNILNSLENQKKNQFFSDLRKFFIIKEVYFKIDTNNFIYEIDDHIFFDEYGIIPKNLFFNVVRKIYYCFFFANLILSEYCSGKEISSKENFSQLDFSIYS